ncbi:MAG: hypothetical protein EXS05_03430 [Planctomycetaceae bacterium]|nr:hypothetical protein [Planctomycetaceae bacterium]
MRELDFELAVGDSVHFANQVLTVIDIHGDEITFRLDRADETAELTPPIGSDFAHNRPPR